MVIPNVCVTALRLKTDIKSILIFEIILCVATKFDMCNEHRNSAICVSLSLFIVRTESI